MTATHEMLHMLGFVHEAMRPDRDDFIAIHKENIERGMEKNFEKRNWGQADFFKKDDVDHMNSPYDVSSLLHYGPQDFSKNGENVLSFLHELPDQTWPEPAPEDPLSLVDEVRKDIIYLVLFLCRWSLQWRMGVSCLRRNYSNTSTSTV